MGSVMICLLATALALTVGSSPERLEADPLIQPTPSSSCTMFDEPRVEGFCLIYRGTAENLEYMASVKTLDYSSWEHWAYNIRGMSVHCDILEHQDEYLTEEKVTPQDSWVGCGGSFYGTTSGEENENENENKSRGRRLKNAWQELCS